jgi:hypothetical protein
MDITDQVNMELDSIAESIREDQIAIQYEDYMKELAIRYQLEANAQAIYVEYSYDMDCIKYHD